VTAISFFDPAGTPAVPDPSDLSEPDGSSPAPDSAVPLRDRLLGAGVVLALLAILAVTVVWRAQRDDSADSLAVGSTPTTVAPDPSGSSTSTVPVPDAWPAEVQPLVTFVEQHRGGKFDHPVPITYLTRDQYEGAAQAETQDTTPQDTSDLQNVEGQLRSLALAGPDLDLQGATEQLYGGGTLAFYDPKANEIKVLGTDLDVAHRVTLVHELTHAWQDQHDFLDKLDGLDDARKTTLQALAEGDAMRIEDEYVDTLSSSDRAAFDKQTAQQGAEVDLGGVPEALITAFSSPYALGAPYVKVLDEQGGNAEINKAMGDPPPAEADLIVLDRFFAGAQPVAVDEPSLPDGAERLDGGEFGAITWIMALSERIDPRDALNLVDRWAGDQSVTYRQDGRVCTAAAYEGLTAADTDNAATRIGAWAAAMPAGYGATVERTGDVAVLRSCEPSSGDAGVVGRTQAALEYPALRTEIVSQALASGATLANAQCFAASVVDSLSVDDMQAGVINQPDRVAQLSAQARAACPG